MASHNNNEERQGQLGQSVSQLFKTPNSLLQTLDVDVANNNDAFASRGSRSRGRPLGSKNKLKKTVVVTQDSPNAFHSHVFEISPGADVIKSLSDYANWREMGISILSGNGLLAHITFHHPEGNIMTLDGQFEILSISGTILPKTGSIFSSPAPPEGMEGLLVYLAGGQGQLIGGYVVPPLVALSPLVLVAASFANPMFDRLPLCSVNQPVTSSPSSVVAATRLAAEGGDSIPLFSMDASAEGRIMISNINHSLSSSVQAI